MSEDKCKSMHSFIHWESHLCVRAHTYTEKLKSVIGSKVCTSSFSHCRQEANRLQTSSLGRDRLSSTSSIISNNRVRLPLKLLFPFVSSALIIMDSFWILDITLLHKDTVTLPITFHKDGTSSSPSQEYPIPDFILKWYSFLSSFPDHIRRSPSSLSITTWPPIWHQFFHLPVHAWMCSLADSL